MDLPVHMNKQIKANRIGIIVKDQEQKKCLLIDVAIPVEGNTSVKVMEKLSKYRYKDINNWSRKDVGTQTTGLNSFDQTDAVTFIINCCYGTIPCDHNNSVHTHKKGQIQK